MTEDDARRRPPGRPPRLAELGETGLIALAQSRFERPHPRVIKGIGDDAALVCPADKTVITCDLLVEDTHFIVARTPPRRLGRKSIAVNLSDLAAMAATPSFAVLGLCAPPGFSTAYLDELLQGMADRADQHGLAIVGGDVCRADRLVIAITALGDAPPPAPVYRAGARPGNLIFVSGQLGDSALGLERLLELDPPVTEAAIAADPLADAIVKHLDPTPRLGLGQALASVASSMIDLSDGLALDLPRLLLASAAPGAVLFAPALPLSDALRHRHRLASDPAGAALAMAVGGGEDYELLFTVPTDREARVLELGRATGVALTRIGEISDREGIRLLGPDGGPIDLPPPLFNHFGGA